MRLHGLTIVALAGVLVIAGGCAQTVKVQFDGPAGSTMTFKDQTFELPEMVELEAPQANEMWEAPPYQRQEVAFSFPLENDVVQAEGVLDVFQFVEQDVDRYARNRCVIEPDQVQQLRDGYAVIVEGHSASNQRIFRLTMGEK